MGIDTVRLSRQVFVIAALYAALAGFLFAHFQRFISPTPFGLGASIDYLFMVIIGGAEWLWGAPLGAVPRRRAARSVQRLDSAPDRPHW